MFFEKMNLNMAYSTHWVYTQQFDLFFSLLYFACFQFLAITNNVDEFTAFNTCSDPTNLLKLWEKMYLDY